jgi:hypothetical protein
MINNLIISPQTFRRGNKPKPPVEFSPVYIYTYPSPSFLLAHCQTKLKKNNIMNINVDRYSQLSVEVTSAVADSNPCWFAYSDDSLASSLSKLMYVVLPASMLLLGAHVPARNKSGFKFVQAVLLDFSLPPAVESLRAGSKHYGSGKLIITLQVNTCQP